MDEEFVQNHEFGHAILFEILQPMGYNSDTINQILTSFNSQSGKQFEAEEYIALHNRKTLIVHKKKMIENSFYFEINRDTTSIQTPFGKLKIQAHESIPNIITKDINFAYLDISKLQFPVIIRNWLPGDSFIPLGMKGSKKISDFLIDKKIPIHCKNQILVLESNGTIAWIIGHRISNLYAIHSKTESVLTLEWIEE